MGKRIASKVLLIGWDAADWQMINPLLADGKMPHLARFIQQGVSGNIATLQPVLSPMLWTTIATGKHADEHGITSFVEPTPEGDGIRPVASTSRKCKALWNILNQTGMRSNVINWFASHPAEPLAGSVVSNAFPALDKYKCVPAKLPQHCIHPPEQATALAPYRIDPHEIGPAEILPFIPQLGKIDMALDSRLPIFRQLLAKTASIHNAATYLMQADAWDLTAIYYGAIDQFGHEFMAYHPPQMADVEDAEFELYKDVMTGVYRYHDMMLHALLQIAGEDTVVIILSDHGYRSGNDRLGREAAAKSPEACHRPYGIACIQGPGIVRGEQLYGASLLDVTPTVLTLLGLAPGADMPGRVWLETIEQKIQVERVMSWDMMPGDDGRHGEELRIDPEAALAAVQQLVELGYIDALDDDQQSRIDFAVKDRSHNLVRVLIHRGKYAEAVAILQKLLAENPNKLSYLIKLSECHLSLGNIDRADALLQHIEGLVEEVSKKEAAQVALLQGMVALAHGDRERSVAHFEAALQHNPDSVPILNRLGNIYLKCQDWERAGKAFARILAQDPDNAFALDGMAQLHIGLQQADKAVDFALDAVGHLHHFPRGHFHLGIALYQMGQQEAAIQAFETCLGMAKNKKQVYFWLEKLYRDSSPEKSQYFRRLMGTQPESEKYFFIEE